MCLNGDLWAHIGNSVTRIQKGVDLKSKGVSLKSKGVSLKSKGVSLKSKGVSLKSDPKRGEFKVKRGEFKVKRGEFKVSSIEKLRDSSKEEEKTGGGKPDSPDPPADVPLLNIGFKRFNALPATATVERKPL
jgi:hypothetical protein